jgi:hypothetical protein
MPNPSMCGQVCGDYLEEFDGNDSLSSGRGA